MSTKDSASVIQILVGSRKGKQLARLLDALDVALLAAHKEEDVVVLSLNSWQVGLNICVDVSFVKPLCGVANRLSMEADEDLEYAARLAMKAVYTLCERAFLPIESVSVVVQLLCRKIAVDPMVIEIMRELLLQDKYMDDIIECLVNILQGDTLETASYFVVPEMTVREKAQSPDRVDIRRAAVFLVSMSTWGAKARKTVKLSEEAVEPLSRPRWLMTLGALQVTAEEFDPTVMEESLLSVQRLVDKFHVSLTDEEWTAMLEILHRAIDGHELCATRLSNYVGRLITADNEEEEAQSGGALRIQMGLSYKMGLRIPPDIASSSTTSSSVTVPTNVSGQHVAPRATSPLQMLRRIGERIGERVGVAGAITAEDDDEDEGSEVEDENEGECTEDDGIIRCKLRELLAKYDGAKGLSVVLNEMRETLVTTVRVVSEMNRFRVTTKQRERRFRAHNHPLETPRIDMKEKEKEVAPLPRGQLSVDPSDELLLRLVGVAPRDMLQSLITHLSVCNRDARWVAVIRALVPLLMPTAEELEKEQSLPPWDPILIRDFMLILAEICRMPLLGHPDILTILEQDLVPRLPFAIDKEDEALNEVYVSLLACVYRSTKSTEVLNWFVRSVREAQLKMAQERCVDALVVLLLSDVHIMPGTHIVQCIASLLSVLEKDSGSNCSQTCVFVVLDCLWRMHSVAGEQVGEGYIPRYLSMLTFSGEEQPSFRGLVETMNDSFIRHNHPSVASLQYRANAENPSPSFNKGAALSSSVRCNREVVLGWDLLDTTIFGREVVQVDSYKILAALIAVYIRNSVWAKHGAEQLSMMSGLSSATPHMKVKADAERARMGNLDTVSLLVIAFVVANDTFDLELDHHHHHHSASCPMSTFANALVDAAGALASDANRPLRVVECAKETAHVGAEQQSSVLPARMLHLLRWAASMGLIVSDGEAEAGAGGATTYLVDELTLTLRLLGLLCDRGQLEPRVTVTALSRVQGLFYSWTRPEPSEGAMRREGRVAWPAWSAILANSVAIAAAAAAPAAAGGCGNMILSPTARAHEEAEAFVGLPMRSSCSTATLCQILDRCLDEVLAFHRFQQEADEHHATGTKTTGTAENVLPASLIRLLCQASAIVYSLCFLVAPTAVGENAEATVFKNKCTKYVFLLLTLLGSSGDNQDADFALSLLLESVERLAQRLSSDSCASLTLEIKEGDETMRICDPHLQAVVTSILSRPADRYWLWSGSSRAHRLYALALRQQWNSLEYDITQWWATDDRLFEVRVGSGPSSGTLMICQRSCLVEQLWKLDIPGFGDLDGSGEGAAGDEDSDAPLDITTSSSNSGTSSRRSSFTNGMGALESPFEAAISDLVRSLLPQGLIRLNAGGKRRSIAVFPALTTALTTATTTYEVDGEETHTATAADVAAPPAAATSVQVPTSEDKLSSSILVLDHTPRRAAHKVALLYRSAVASNEEDILGGAHEDASVEFQRFCEELGEIRPLSELDFCGGLHAKDDGTHALVNETAHDIVVFHTPTLMLLGDKVDGCKGLLRRKGHVGNDAVHVIYVDRGAVGPGGGAMWHMEDGPESSVSFLSGDFGMVEIVVTSSLTHGPADRLENQVMRVHVRVKKSLEGLHWLTITQIMPYSCCVAFVRMYCSLASFGCQSYLRERLGTSCTSNVLARQRTIAWCKKKYARDDSNRGIKVSAMSPSHFKST